MKNITEKTLLDNFTGITNGYCNISDIDGEKIIWDYRSGDDGDGYNPAVDKREDAEEIYLFSSEKMIDLEQGCENHPALEKIYELQEN